MNFIALHSTWDEEIPAQPIWVNLDLVTHFQKASPDAQAPLSDAETTIRFMDGTVIMVTEKHSDIAAIIKSEI